eukprot:m.144259 g.144259  ORF g.144259 m.144259 type:complete len:306 (-) comp52658_c0_seq7:107-1024(-)
MLLSRDEPLANEVLHATDRLSAQMLLEATTNLGYNPRDRVPFIVYQFPDPSSLSAFREGVCSLSRPAVRLVSDPWLRLTVHASIWLSVASCASLIALELWAWRLPLSAWLESLSFWIRWPLFGLVRLASGSLKVWFVLCAYIGALNEFESIEDSFFVHDFFATKFERSRGVFPVVILPGIVISTLALASDSGGSLFSFTAVSTVLFVVGFYLHYTVWTWFAGNPFVTRTAFRKAFTGFTPLHIAALMGHEDMTTLLLRAGADPTATTAAGLTAKQVAQRIGRAQVVVEIIEAHQQRLASAHQHLD